MPWSSAVAVACVAALTLSRTLSVPDDSSVHADQSPELVEAAPISPAGVPPRLAKRNCPSQPPPALGPQSIALSVYVSTTCSRPRTSTGAAPGEKTLDGKPPFVIPCVRRWPRASLVTRRR